MAIQPQIAMGFQMPQFQLPNQGNMLMQVAQLESSRQANELRRAQMAQLERAQEQENALLAMSPTDLQADPTAALRFGKPGRETYSALLAGERERRQAQLAEAQAIPKKIELMKFGLGSVNSPEQYASWREQTAKLLPGLAGVLPQEFTPDTKRSMMLDADKLYERVFESIDRGNVREVLALSRYGGGAPETVAVREIGARPQTPVQQQLTQAQTERLRMEMAGTLPRAEQQRLAPSIQIIADPTDPSQQLLVDATVYRGGGLGSPGVLGRPGITREPAPVLTTIQDPNDPTRTIVVNARSFQWPRDGAGTPGMVGVAGAQATVSREDVKKELAQTQLNDTLDAIGGMYAELNRLGGIASTERSAFTNVPARIAGSAVGQIAGQAIGTQEQSLRDRIAAARFTLVQQIKNATGMSARQMDSNVELQNTLNSLSDPRQGYEAAINIIENLRKTYGLGGAPATEPASRGAAGGQPAAPAQPASGAPIRLPKDNADAVYNSLPSGAQFIDPNGVLRRKP
jgi:hypothetical protein